MSILRVVLTAIAVFILQVTIVHSISIGGISPDLMIILLVAVVLDRSPVVAVMIGFLLGFLQDLGNASFLGMNAMAKSIVAYGVSRVGGGYFPDNFLFKGLLIVTAALVNDIITLVITTSFSTGEILVSFFRYSILSAFYTALFGVAVLELMRVVSRRVVR